MLFFSCQALLFTRATEYFLAGECPRWDDRVRKVVGVWLCVYNWLGLLTRNEEDTILTDSCCHEFGLRVYCKQDTDDYHNRRRWTLPPTLDSSTKTALHWSYTVIFTMRHKKMRI